VGIAALCAAAAAAAAPTAPERAVGCADAVDVRVEGTRILLGAVVLSPGRELERPSLRGDARWRWFRPARIAVRDGEPDVSASVPLGWRERLAVSWGGSEPTGDVGFGRCVSPGRGWTVYEGGLHLRKRADCVPLLVRVGGTSTTVRFGVGRTCGSTGRG
jgi:hypothetical protein